MAANLGGRPVSVVAAGGAPFVQVSNGAAIATPVADGKGPPITLVSSGAPPIVLVSDDGSPYVLSIPNLQALYDPSDLTSIYQSRTGGSTGAVDAVVGIMLDKKMMGGKTAAAFIAGQSELVSNPGPFANTTGWASPLGSIAAAGGKLVLTCATNGRAVSPALSGLTIGRRYRVTLIGVDGTAGTKSLRVTTNSDGSTGAVFTQAISGSSIEYWFVATATTHYLALVATGSSGQTFEISAASVKEIPGNHALAPSDAGRPTLKSGYIDFDGVDDVLNAVIGANLGAACSVYHRTQAGSHVWLDAQTINAGNYAMSTTDWRKAAIFSSEPSAANKAIVEAWGAS